MRAVLATLVAAGACAAVAHAGSAKITVHPGQGFKVAGTNIVCTYGGSAGTSGGLACRTQSSSGPIVNSYSVSASATGVSVYRFTAPTKAARVKAWTHPGAKDAPAFDTDYFRIAMVGSAAAGATVDVVPAGVRCTVARGAASPGVLGIACGLASGGTYTAAIDQTGATVRKRGQSTPVWHHAHGG